MAENWGLCPFFWGGELAAYLAQYGLVRRPSGILIHPAIWPQEIWAENWCVCPFGGGGVGSPSNTMWPRPRPTRTPTFILIHPTIWPQYTNVTDRTAKTDRQTTVR